MNLCLPSFKVSPLFFPSAPTPLLPPPPQKEERQGKLISPRLFQSVDVLEQLLFQPQLEKQKMKEWVRLVSFMSISGNRSEVTMREGKKEISESIADLKIETICNITSLMH